MITLKFNELKIGMIISDVRVEDLVYEVVEIHENHVVILSCSKSIREVSVKAFDVSGFFTEVL